MSLAVTRLSSSLACCLLACGCLGQATSPASDYCSDGITLLQTDKSSQGHEAHLNVDLVTLESQLEKGHLLGSSIFKHSQDPLRDLGKFLDVLFTAVRQDSFMKTISDMEQSTTEAIKEFKDRSKKLRSSFDNEVEQRIAHEKLRQLTAEYFTKEARLISLYYEKRQIINIRSSESMPGDMAQSLNEVMRKVIPPTAEEALQVTKTMTVDTEESTFCSTASVLMANISDTRKGMKDTKKMINSTQSMTPMIKAYLKVSKPELMPRIIWVLDKVLDLEFRGADAVDGITANVANSVYPVLTERLGCRGSAAGAGLSVVMWFGLFLRLFLVPSMP